VKIEDGEERMRDCDEVMWTNGHPFIRLSGSLVVAVIVLSIGGRRTPGFMHSSFGIINDFFKEYKPR
jgi:hypothetical protein